MGNQYDAWLDYDMLSNGRKRRKIAERGGKCPRTDEHV
jgi:hypothetical protein